LSGIQKAGISNVKNPVVGYSHRLWRA